MSFSLLTTSVANTGGILGDVSPGIIKTFAIWNGSKAISAITGAAFQPFLEASSVKAKADGDKLFLFPDIQDIADKSEANKEGSLNQGFKITLIEGKPAYEYKVFAGATQTPFLRKFNNQSVRLLTFDKNNRVWGVKSGNSFIGRQAKIFVQGLKDPTGQNVEEGVVTIAVSYLDPTELNDNAAYGEVESYSNIKSLLDVQLSEGTAHASNVFKIQGLIPTAEVGEALNLGDYFGAELADDAMWVVTTGTNYGTVVTITSVAYDSANKWWTVTLDSTEFTALANGAKIKFALAAPPVLDAAGVVEVEGIPVIATK